MAVAEIRPPRKFSVCVRSVDGPSPISTRSKGPSVNWQRAFLDIDATTFDSLVCTSEPGFVANLDSQINRLLFNSCEIVSRGYNVDRGDEKWIRISFDMTDITEQLNTFMTDSRVKELQGKIKSFDISDEKFDMFKVMGVSSSELTHSNVLGWLLDSEKSHGIGNNFATAFFGEAVGLELNPDFDFHGMEIRREWQNIDLCCVSPANRFVCVIENKTDSGEHDNQLNRYHQIIAKEFPDYEKSFVYLTVDGENPSSDEYIPVSYRKIDRIVQQ